MIMNHEKLYRLYSEEGIAGTRAQTGAWVTRTDASVRHDQCTLVHGLSGRYFWGIPQVCSPWSSNQWRTGLTLAVIDNCCRDNLFLIADTSLSGARVARELDALIRIYGKPAFIVCENRTEFTSRSILKWADKNGVLCFPQRPVVDPALT